MDINKPFTHKMIQEAMDKINPNKMVHVNQQTYTEMVEKLGFEPVNLIVNNFIPNNKAIIIKG
jgi:hypothetical protein